MNATISHSIFLVEDDHRLAGLIAGYLQSNGFAVAIADLQRPVADQVRESAPDMVILDLGLPGQNGLSICRQLRETYLNPILILTARKDDIDHVLGLELGADDYVVKPVEPRVLMARIKAHLRRSSAATEASRETLSFGRLRVDAVARSVKLNGEPVALSSNEFDLLLHLARNAGVIQSREALFKALYGREYDGIDRILDVRISHLRRKLGDDTNRSERIKTIWGHGYLFVPGDW
jgi:two-component system OmpR family response regulator/two-component system response regulator RstA